MQRQNYWQYGLIMTVSVILSLLCMLGCSHTNANSLPDELLADLPFVVVVSDPLAIDHACSCIAGFAQRDYRSLSLYLKETLGHARDGSVHLIFANTVRRGLDKSPTGQIDLVIGKETLIAAEAKRQSLDLERVAALTGRDGGTTFHGVFVVRDEDTAQTIGDLGGHRIFFGLADADEKHAAAVDSLRSCGVVVPPQLETFTTCREAAQALLEDDGVKPIAAVISDYALVLLEGCESIPRGALRTIGTTAEVPFVAAFIPNSVPAPRRKQIVAALADFSTDPVRRQELETRDGFVLVTSQKNTATNILPWTQWRGPDRLASGVVFPETLPQSPRILWSRQMSGDGIAGLVTDGRSLIVADRDATDRCDSFRCLDAATGEERWCYRDETLGSLDYGNSPRATPLILDDVVVTLSAFGALTCLDLASGRVLWRRDLVSELGGRRPHWGFTASPLEVDGAVIVQPGGETAGLAAIDIATGSERWRSPGGRVAGYASPMLATLGGVRQIIAYDAESLGGWNPANGERLWEIVPPYANDFNVPTPIPLDGERLFVATENNGARIYSFNTSGRPNPTPTVISRELLHDSNTPAFLGETIYGVSDELIALNSTTLEVRWRFENSEPFGMYTSIIAGTGNILLTRDSGEMIVVDVSGAAPRVAASWRMVPQDDVIYSHPAIVGDVLYVRSAGIVLAASLREEGN